MAISPNGYTDDFGPNVANILCGGSRVIRGKVPAQVLAELRAAVKSGVLGRLPKDGLKPEIYFHPSRKNLAIEIQTRYALVDIANIAKVVAVIPVEQRVQAAISSLIANRT